MTGKNPHRKFYGFPEFSLKLAKTKEPMANFPKACQANLIFAKKTK